MRPFDPRQQRDTSTVGPDRPRRSGLAAVVAVMTLMVTVSACGISLDDAPRPIDTAVSTTTTTGVETSENEEAILYYVLDESLVPIPSQVPDDRLATLVAELIKPLAKDDKSSPVKTSIPSGTRLRSAVQRGTVLVVDLSEEFGNMVGSSRQKAIGQIVLTVTQLDRVREVRFRIDGEEIQVPSATRGDVTTVGPCDFKGLLATVDQITGARLGEAVIVPLAYRRVKLDRICGS